MFAEICRNHATFKNLKSHQFRSEKGDVFRIMKNVAEGYKRCILYPAVAVHLNEFKDYGIEIKLFFWVSNVENGIMEPKSDVMIAILEEFEKEIGVKLKIEKKDEIDTIGGFIFFLIGRIPGRGEVINYNKLLEFTIVEADTRRIKKILVTLKK